MLKMPPITKNLLIINLLCFAATFVFDKTFHIDLNNYLGLHFFMANDFQLYQLVTYMFMHAGIEHILINMFMLWMFGTIIENTFGQRRFIIYYIICGVGAGLMQEAAQLFWLMFDISAQTGLNMAQTYLYMQTIGEQLNALTTVGASGAVYALLLAFGMLFPEERMFIIPIPFPIKAKWMVMGSIAIEFFSAINSPGSQVAHLAHLGGMLFGFLLIRYWKKHPYGYGTGYGPSFDDMFRHIKWNRDNQKNKQRFTTTTNEDPDWTYNRQKKATQEEIDQILDKIRKSGYDSLSAEEKRKLFEQGNNNLNNT